MGETRRASGDGLWGSVKTSEGIGASEARRGLLNQPEIEVDEERDGDTVITVTTDTLYKIHSM